jgi:hypothetical protein
MQIKLNQIENGTLGQILSMGVSGLTYTTLSPRFSSIISANSINTIDNLNFGQNWNWSTLNTGTGLTLNFNALTTGTGLSITTNSAINSTNGLLSVINSSTSTTGVVFKAQSNNSNPGLNVLANGRIGINTSNPNSNLEINGSHSASYRVITATTTLLDTDYIIYINNGATNITVTLPNIDKRIFQIVRYSNTSTGTITLQLAGGTIQARGGAIGATTTLSTVAGQRSEKFQVTAGVARRLSNN